MKELYRFQTKGEMLSNTLNKPLLAETAKLSMSCSHPEAGRYHGWTPNNHCGYCVPCIIRRASMAAAGLDDAPHGIDVINHPPDATTDTGADLRAFQMAIERFITGRTNDPLFRVLATGPLPPEEAAELAAVFTRGMLELKDFLIPRRSDVA